MTAITPGYILTDDDGDSIGLTLTEIAAIVGEWDVPGSPENRAARSEFHVGDLGITWYRYGDSKGRGMVLTRHDRDTYVTIEAVTLLRGILAAQEQPSPSPVPRPVVERGDVAGEVET